MWMGERFERCGIAIAGCLEGSGTRYFEGQLIICERTLIAVLVQKAHGDKGEVIAISIQKHIVLICTALCQTKKTLSMEEIWNIGIFLQIAIIENIREICEKIYSCQLQKYKAESITEKWVENKAKQDQHFKTGEIRRIEKDAYSFVEYMSYILKRYGKKGYSYLKALEEAVEMTRKHCSRSHKKRTL